MTKVILIKDEDDEVWGVAPSITQANRQIKWYLPRGNSYKIECIWYF